MDISIIICTYNRSELLKDTLESLTRLRIPTGLQAEFLIVDNGSTDSTREVVAAYPRFRLRVELRKGLSAARNCGIRESSGQVLLFTDDDIRVMPDWMEQLSRPLMNGSADGVTGVVKLPLHLQRSWMTTLHKGWLASQELDFENPHQMVGANMGFSRRVLQKVSYFDEELGPGMLGTADDQFFSLQVREAGFKIIGVETAIVWHHFDSERLRREQWIKAAKRAGRSEAYIDHHWLHKSIPSLRYQYCRAVTRYIFWRIIRWKECTSSEGISEWELQLLKYKYRLEHHLVERKRTPHYNCRGLIKI